MKIGLISDTHGSCSAWEAAIRGPLSGSEMILHAGDVLYHGPRNPLPEGYAAGELAEVMNQSAAPVLIAQGNCDSEVDQMVLNWPLQAPFAVYHCSLGPILIVHGHGHDSTSLVSLSKRMKASVVVTGHTHIPGIMYKDGVWLVNPGSPALPKGPSPVPTVGWLHDEGICVGHLDGGDILIHERW